MLHIAKPIAISMRLAAAWASALCLLAAGLPAGAEDTRYPTMPIKLIVPYAPGGPTDVLARNLAAKMSETLGKPMVVENRTGAGGIIGAAAVAQAPADGYTILFHEIAATFAIQPLITKSINYDVRKDFTPIGLSAAGPVFLIVNAGVPAKNLKELFELAKKGPGDISFASAGGIGQLPTHIGPELLMVKYGLKMRHIPYKGTGPALVDVAAGRVSMIMTTGLGSAQAFLDTGKVKVLAITGEKRADALPNIPTFAEQGFPLPEMDGGTMWGLLGPAGLSREIVDKLNASANKAMTSADIRDKLAVLNIGPRTSTPEELDAIIKKEMKIWPPIVQRMNIQAD